VTGRQMTECAHDWRWTSRVHFVVNRYRRFQYGYNVQCSKCGAREWAHGRHGNRPVVTEIETPTTEGATRA
jgi:hypothetical protein